MPPPDVSSDSSRRSGLLSQDPSNRSDFWRDRDRIYYSDEFRRLEDVTQVTPGFSTAKHNRLTHTLRVEQVGRSIVSALNERYGEQGLHLDKDVVGAACLAHDIGHPPFGHTGELALQKVLTCKTHSEFAPTHRERRTTKRCNCILPDSFEGNAQTLRIAATIGIRSDYTDSGNSPAGPYGFDLSRKVLAALSKYPWLRGENKSKPKKWGAYDCDVDALAFLNLRSSRRSLEADVMDAADDIAYAVHDLEDYYRAGLIPLGQMRGGTQSEEALFSYLDGSREAISQHEFLVGAIDQFGQLAEMRKRDEVTQDEIERFRTEQCDDLSRLEDFMLQLPEKRFTGGARDIATVSRLRSMLITKFIGSLTYQDGHIYIGDDYTRSIVTFLQQLTWFYVIDTPELSTLRKGQEELIGRSFDALFALGQSVWGSRTHYEDKKLLRNIPLRLVAYYKFGIRQHNQHSERYTHDEVIARAVVDYMSSLTDGELYRLGNQLAGVGVLKENFPG